MTYETLQYVDGNGDTQEVAVESLYSGGPAISLRFMPRSHAASEFHILLPQPPEIDIQIPFKSRCVVWACRTSETGEANSFGGGTMIFQGRRTDNQGSASGQKVTSEIILSDALWDLKQLTYLIPWAYISEGITFFDYLFPDIVLFQEDPNGQLQSNGTYAPYDPQPDQDLITTWQQILAIVNYAISYAPFNSNESVHLQIGANPEFLPVYCNTYPVRSQKCLDCLTNCLRPHPGVFTFVDYTTSPPTLHFRNRGSMVNTVLPYKSTDENFVVHLQADIKALPELVPSQVSIFYKVTQTENGQSVVGFDQDIYPLGGPFLQVAAYSIDISGPSTNTTIKNFTSYDFDPTSLTLWRDKVPSLHQVSEGGQIPNDGSLGALQMVSTEPYDPDANPKGIQVIDDAGNAVDYADTYIYATEQAVLNWFSVYVETTSEGPQYTPAVAVHATVKAFFSYNKVTSAGAGANETTLTDTALEHQETMRLMLTNAPTDQYTISQLVNTGEAIPGGLAEAVYNELSVLQYKLRHEIFQVAADENTVPLLIQPGNQMINLAGGAVEWETMNAVPDSVTIELYRTGDGRLAARSDISCGPIDHLEPGYLVQLYNLFANRNLRQIDVNARLSGEPSNQGTDLTGTESKENSVPGPAVPQVLNIAAVDSASGTVSTLTLDASQIFAASQLNAGGA